MITMKSENPSVTKVGDLIDYDNKAWHEELIREIFVPYDVESILSIRLSEQWPNDKLVWHYTSNGIFSVRLAYYFVVKERNKNEGESSKPDELLWKSIWNMQVPPRIKRFIWRLCRGIV